MEYMFNKRNVIGFILTLILIGTIAYAVTNRDTIFKNEVVVEYPDGCIEKFVNGNLVTEECTEGRILYEESINGPSHNLPFDSGDIKWIQEKENE